MRALPSTVRVALLVSALVLYCLAASATAAPQIQGGEVIVKFKPGAPQTAINAIRADLHATTIHRFGRIGAEHDRISGSTSVPDAIARYRNNPAIEFIEPNYIVSIVRTPDDPLFPQLWGLRNTGQTGGLPGADISATEAWDTSTGSSNVIVGVIDTGVDYTHPDLAGNIYVNAAEIPNNGIDDDANGFVDDIHGWDFVNFDNDPMDDHGHGTHVSGTIGAIGNNGIGVTGVSWSVRIMPLKFLNAGGSGTTADAIAAIEYAIPMGVKVLSNSWGGGGYSEALRLAILDANNAGILFVAAAGNESSNNDVFPAYPASYDVPNVISVAATNSVDQLAGFSNFGATTVDLGAPGTDILSTLPSAQYGLLSGTSMATPHVSGALALILARFPSISVSDAKTLLLNAVDPLPALSGKVLSGGRLNVAKALEGPDSIAPNPIVDLVALAATSNGVPLQWTATGDDGTIGTVSAYDIRYSSFEITDANFESASRYGATFEPHPPGSLEQAEVKGLAFSTTYYFAIKARDEYGNRSPISNVVSATTLGPPDIDVSPSALSAALLTGGTVTRTLTLRNLAAGTLDFSLGTLTEAPGSGARTGEPSPSGLPLVGVSGSHRWGDYVSTVPTNFIASPLFGAGTVRTATLPDVITDPSGDGSSVDLTVLRGLGDRGTLQIEMELSTPIDRFNFGGYLSLDVDRNRATGFPPSAGNGLQDIGAEYEFQLFSLASGVVDLYNIVLGTYVGSFPVEIGARTLRFSVPLDLLSHDDGTMDVTGVIGNASGPTDWFPDSGHGTIQGIQFLSFAPSTGTVPPGGSVDVQVTFDATGLFGGGYDESIRIASNDPDEAEVLVPAHLDVTGAPDIALSSVVVDYGPVFLGVSKAATVVVSNVGTDLLTVTSMTASPAEFGLDPSGFSLAPGASRDVIVTFSPQNVGAIEGLLTIASNDHDEGSVTVALHGYGLIAPDIGVDPSTFTASLTTGETATSVLTVQNTGGSDLNFGVRTRRSPATSGVGGPPVSLPSSLRVPTRNQTQPSVGPPSVRAEYEGTFLRFGITDFGEIMPFQSPLGNEHLAVGTFLSGYTVAYRTGGVDHICYSVNSERLGVIPVSYREIENTPAKVSVEVVTRTSDGVLGIRRVFTFPRARKYVAVTTELQNLSSGTVTQVVLKEDTDWDVDGNFFDGWDYDRTRNMVYAWSEHYAAVGADRAPDLMDIYGWNDYYSRATTVDIPSGPVSAYDGLEVLHFELGTLAPSQKLPVSLAYAVGSNLAELQREMDTATGVRWLAVSPETGVVPAGGSAELAVKFDPGTLTTGDYAGQIVVESNDPDEAEVALPASLHVTGIPDVALSPEILDFGSPFVGQVVTRTLQVTNLGTSRLEVASITPDLAAYTVDTAAFGLDPFESRALSVTFSPSSVGLQNSILTIVSDDPDEGSVTVALHGEGLPAPVIGVTPASLSAALLTGESTSQPLTIHNTGGSDLHFTVGQQAAAFGAAAAASLRVNGHGPAPVALAAMTSLKLGITGSFASTAVPNALAAANRVLVPQDSVPSGSEILVITNTSIGGSVLRALGELGHGYDLVFADDFTGIDFTAYRTIVVVMDGGPINEASCQALANAAAGGRLLFMLGGTNYPPYYNGVQTYLLSHTGEVGWVPSAPPHLSVVDASDRLADGLPASYTFSDLTLPYYMLRINDPAARVAVGNGDHHPALVHKSLGAGTLVYYINPGDDYFWGNPSDFAILKRIVQNALALGSVPWLSVAPNSGTVAPGGSIDLNVTFDATGLFGGGYDASIRVASNDPHTTEVLVPAHLNVTGAPDIAVSSVALGYGTVFIGVSKPATVVVSNVGTDLLTVSGVTASPGDFGVDTGGFSLAPGASRDVVVTFSPQSVGAIDGLLTIASNDSDEGSVTVTLHGEGLLAPVIGVTPASLSAALLTGGSTSQPLTIRNTGGSDLHFTVNTQAGVVAAAAAASLRTSGRGSASVALAAMTSLKFGNTASFGSTAVSNALAAANQVLVPQDSVPSGSDILVIATTSIDTSVLRALEELGHGYDLMYAQDFTGIDFTPYRTIVVAMDGGLINEASCQALANAAAGGRLLFMLGGTSYGPYYNGVQTYLLSHTGEIDWVQSAPPHLSVVDASDPLADGLPASYTFGDPGASYYMLRINDPAAQVAVENGDHHPALVHKLLGAGTLVYDINSPASLYWGNASDFSILKQIVKNALALGGMSWLSIEPRSGTVAPGGSIDLNVTFDATGLFGGGYDASIRVASNDPHTTEVLVPAHLNVTGVPDIAVSSVALSYGTVFIGVSKPATVVVSNVGTDLLTVSGVTTSPGDFGVDTGGFSLAPGASRDVVVTFSPQSVGAIDGLLTIASNDSDEGSVTVTLHGEGLLAPRIVVSPASLRADLLSGESSSQTMTVQNDGGSDLVFAVALTNFVFPATVPATTAPSRTASEIVSGYDEYRANPSSGSASPVHPSPQPGVIPIWERVQAALSDSFIVFHDDVEAGPNGWTHYATDPVGTDQWGISTSRSSSGSRSWQVSQHDGSGADALQSPAIDLSGYVNATLTFKHWYNFDDCSGDPTFEPDGGIVEVSRDGGSTWNQITPLGGYPYVLDNICGNTLAFRPAYSHDGGDGAAFVPAVFDLTPYVGGSVRIRFHAGWDCGNCGFNEGWYIDDVTVYSGAPRFVAVTPVSGTVAAGSSQSLGVDFKSEGLDAGAYNLDIVVSSNDPVTPAKTVPATMHVIGVPFISVTPTSLVFAPLFVGQSSTQTLVVKNTGTERLSVTGMSSSEGSYSASPTAFNLEPRVSQIVTVTFAPTSIGTKNGALAIAHNASGSPTSVSLSGSGITPPILSLAPDSIRVSLNPGAVGTANVTIGNVGGSDLQFSLDVRAAGVPVAVSTDPPLAKGVEDRRVGAPVVLRSGGPDLFGHRWIDSDSPGGPVFNWLNIVPVGTQIPLTGDDATSAPIPIGFPFHYFGSAFTAVRVSTNGYLSFTSTLASYSNQPLPSTAAPENLLAVFWDDLNFDPFSYAFYYYDGGRFIVQFENVHRIDGGGPYTFEVILYPSGNIVYQYLAMSPSLISATIGCQNAAQNDGLTVVFDNNYVHNNLAVRIETGLPWLTLNPRDGTIPTGGTMDVRAFLNTAGQSLGDHRGVIDVYTNDPIASTRSIPVTLHVNGDDPPIVSAPATASGAEGLPLTLSVSASDPEGDTMYSLDAAPLPRGATFVANDTKSAGELHWTPDYDQAGTFTVTISATSARHAHPVSGPIDPLEGSATVAITIANTDRAPVVTAPATQTVAEGVLLTFTVTAADPDGDPVATLEPVEIPVGATYARDPVQPRGTFTWTPTFASAGNYSVTFTATNALAGSATTVITVTNQNRAPMANAGGPYTGMPGVPIAFDGTRSSDPDGESLDFAWNYGDGQLGSGPSPMHAYASMAGSPFTVTLTVSDGSLSGSATTTATIQGTFAANVFFPLNLDYFFPQILPGWVRIEPIANSFAISDVLLSTITMSYNGSSIPATCKSIVDHDRNHNGISEIRVCFTRDGLKALFASLPNGTSTVIVKLEGGLLGGGKFQGTTSVHVIKLNFLGAGTLASVSPNPLNPQAKLTFVTTQPGIASVQMFDLNGRLVRTLMAEQSTSPGIHEVTVDGRNEQGNRLASGVYYYRVRSVDGITKGTLVMLK